MNMSVHLYCTAPGAIHTPYIDTYSLFLVSPRHVAILAFLHTFYVFVSTLLFLYFSFRRLYLIYLFFCLPILFLFLFGSVKIIMYGI